MWDLLIALVLTTELIAFARYRRRPGWTSASGLTGLYIIAAQIMAWLVLHDILGHEMLALYGGPDQDMDLRRAIFCAGALFVVVYALELAFGDNATPSTPDLGRTHFPTALAIVCAGIWCAAALVASTSMDWERLWSTPHYLDLTDPAAMTGNARAALALSALPLAGAASAAAAAAMLATQPALNVPSRTLLGAALTLQALVTMLWLLAAHSRAAAMAPAAFGFVTLIMCRRRGDDWRRMTSIAVSIAFVVVALGGALAGRNLGEHGLASLALLPGQLADVRAWAPMLASNVTEGIFGVAAGLGEWLRSSGDSVQLFPSNYIWLSFSPLPSGIDGFASILHAQVRLHAFAPMPGYVELAWFGPWSQLGFLALLALAFRMAANAADLSPLSGGGASLLLAGCLYVMAAYPVRTALKLLWLSLGVSGLTYVAAKLRSPLQRPPPGPDPFPIRRQRPVDKYALTARHHGA